MTTFQERGEKLHQLGYFVGCPLEDFERTAKDPFIVLLREGLVPESKVLEIGTGVLRNAYWPLHFLQPGGLCGLEPRRDAVEAGCEILVGEDTIREKQPRFDFNAHYDTSAFSEIFDFVFSFSTWTHAPKVQIERMLDEFAERGRSASKFVTSFLPPFADNPDYQGDVWVGRSHLSDVPGTVTHDFKWIEKQCRRRSFVLRRFLEFKTIGQSWLVIEKPR